MHLQIILVLVLSSTLQFASADDTKGGKWWMRQAALQLPPRNPIPADENLPEIPKVLPETAIDDEKTPAKLMPYAFSYTADAEGGKSSREEVSDGRKVEGQYTVEGPDGIQRIVYYVADENGFRATVVTNEPGTETHYPAGVNFQSSQLPGNPIAAKLTTKGKYALSENEASKSAKGKPAIKLPSVSAPLIAPRDIYQQRLTQGEQEEDERRLESPLEAYEQVELIPLRFKDGAKGEREEQKVFSQEKIVSEKLQQIKEQSGRYSEQISEPLK